MYISKQKEIHPLHHCSICTLFPLVKHPLSEQSADWWLLAPVVHAVTGEMKQVHQNFHFALINGDKVQLRRSDYNTM